MRLAPGRMLQHVGRRERADRLTAASDATLAAGVRTRDLGGTAGTRELTDALLHPLR